MCQDSAIVPVITIDGPAGVGKTTLARRMADSLNVSYMDTGAMFRCWALKLGAGAEKQDEESLRCQCAAWQFTLSGSGAGTTLLCAGQPVRNEVRTETVGMLASRLATVPVIRELLKAAQQHMGAHMPLVVEGRDMGTVVFPQARFKFFLDASPEVRAMRRLRELEERGERPQLSELTEQIRKRDSMDRTRAVAPLRAATDAVVVDTSSLDIDGVLGVMMHHISVHGGLR
ncbi:MAG: (d)CMP kinase [Desulfovibrionaceae bacterium]